LGDISRVERLLSRFGSIKGVGRSFGVLKLRVDGLDLDISMPRVEYKVGDGHRGFRVELDENYPFRGGLSARESRLRKEPLTKWKCPNPGLSFLP